MQMQMPFQFPDGRPKQKRHRCRNPNKIDVNSLTGEERVQIINRRNARKVGVMCAMESHQHAQLLPCLRGSEITGNRKSEFIGYACCVIKTEENFKEKKITD